MNKVEIQKLVGGAVQEQFGKSFEKVLENLMNPNTSYKDTRDITIKLKFKQNESRDDVKCEICVSEKLAPQQPMGTSFAIGKDLRTGQMYAKEYGKHLEGQMHIDDYLNQEEGAAVLDESTGEILSALKESINEANTKIINFKERKVASV